jgi:autotransporter passenger strand-loop-strand repeat protein
MRFSKIKHLAVDTSCCGQEYVGGVASNTIVNGGDQYVQGGGSAIHTTLYSGGLQFVQSNGTATIQRSALAATSCYRRAE